jgi:tRNA U34 5-methylaminomethyl-2-thiouridine-forming methyltransferase MnmC
MDENFKIVQCTDGSETIYDSSLNEYYHSVHGAYTESIHVYIQNGLHMLLKSKPHVLHVLEVGMGTGLNVLLTLEHAGDCKINYTALEPHPLNDALLSHYNFSKLKYPHLANLLHQAPYQQNIALTPHFVVNKLKLGIEDLQCPAQFNLVYFDAFSPRVQPNIWSPENFNKLYSVLLPHGILVTYCCKGDVRRAMQEAGFSVERLPGPPGKREMLRAKKIRT